MSVSRCRALNKLAFKALPCWFPLFLTHSPSQPSRQRHPRRTTTTMVVYTSAWPSVPIPEKSVFSHIFNSDLCTPEQVVYVDGPTGRRFTKANVKHTALSLAHGLRNELHTQSFRGPLLVRGDTVMIFSQNNVLYPVFLWGIFAAGLRATPAPSTASPNEVQRQWIDSEAKVMIVSSSLVHTALAMFKHLNLSPEDALSRMIVYSDGETTQLPKGFKFTRYEDLSTRGLLPKEELFDGQLSNQTALLCYSSGTSGQPKGVEVNPILSFTSFYYILTRFTPDHTQEPGSAVGYAPIDRNSRNPPSVGDLSGPVLPHIWRSKLPDDSDLPRHCVGVNAAVRDDRVLEVHRCVPSHPCMGRSTYLLGTPRSPT